MDKKVFRRRTEKQAIRWQRKLDRYRALQNQIKREASDILQSKNFNQMKGYIQHGNVTVNAHVMNVARYSITFSEKLHISCHKRELIRGALLHDYFLYDWHIPNAENPHKLHGFYHPGVALRNALKEYDLTKREQNIIRRHMWPLTVVPPGCREAWIVTTADKWCSLMETLHMHKGHGIVLEELENIEKSEETKGLKNVKKPENTEKPEVTKELKNVKEQENTEKPENKENLKRIEQLDKAEKRKSCGKRAEQEKKKEYKNVIQKHPLEQNTSGVNKSGAFI